MASDLTRWLQDHGAGGRRLARVLDRYFKGQTSRLATALSRQQWLSAGALDNTVDEVFDASAEHAALMEILPAPLAGLAAAGAIRVLDAIKRRQRRRTRERKDATTDSTFDDFEVAVADELATFELPDHVREAIKTAIGELVEQPYWREIQDTTKTSLTQILAGGIEEGLNGSQLAKRINEALGGQQKVRARLIARTETTALFNSGHQVVYDQLAAEGLIIGKTWLSIVDNRTRDAHVTLNNTTVKPDEDFDVGGEKAPYPGHHSLSARNRANCRCVTVSAFSEVL